MKASWVLSDEEKRARLMKKSENRVKRHQHPKCQKVEDEDDEWRRWLQAEAETRNSLPLSQSLLQELNTASKSGGSLGEAAIVDLFTSAYSRVVDFVGRVDAFRGLDDADKRLLLASNLDSITNVRLNVGLNRDGSGNRERQTALLGGLNGEDVICKPLQLGQVFVSPWAKSESHYKDFARTMTKLAGLIDGDSKSAVMFQVVCLFNASSNGVKDRKCIEEAQLKAVLALQNYLRSKYGYTKGNSKLADFVLIIADLARLSEILIS